MATIKQINANRKNALLSRGPTSKLGKLNSSKNSLKHGLTAKQLVIGENLKDFEQYRDLMIEALKPEGILEEQVVFKIIDVGFRLQRIGGIEAGIYNQEILHHEADEYKNKIAEKIEFKEEGELVQSSDKPTNSFPSSFILPSVITEFSGCNCNKVMATEVFPHPDSPTSPNDSPLLMLNEISLTAETFPANVS